MPSVIASKDNEEDIEIEYERGNDAEWHIKKPGGDIQKVNPNASRRTVEQLIRKEYDDDY